MSALEGSSPWGLCHHSPRIQSAETSHLIELTWLGQACSLSWGYPLHTLVFGIGHKVGKRSLISCDDSTPKVVPNLLKHVQIHNTKIMETLTLFLLSAVEAPILHKPLSSFPAPRELFFAMSHDSSLIVSLTHHMLSVYLHQVAFHKINICMSFYCCWSTTVWVIFQGLSARCEATYSTTSS